MGCILSSDKIFNIALNIQKRIMKIKIKHLIEKKQKKEEENQKRETENQVDNRKVIFEILLKSDSEKSII